jgi:hypothetical protein
LPSTLPTNQEACTLVNPNVQVVSEEIRAKIDQERMRLARIARMQLKQKLKHSGFIRAADEAEDEAPQQRSRKGKTKEKELVGSGNKRHKGKSHQP